MAKAGGIDGAAAVVGDWRSETQVADGRLGKRNT